MNKFKKILSCALAAFTFCSAIAVPMNLNVLAGGLPSRGPSVSISGAALIGNTMTGTYNNTSTTTTPDSYNYQWLISSTSSGTYTAVNGATNAAYTPTSDELGKYLELQVTPVTGGVSGTAVTSSSLQVAYNITNNYSFEKSDSSWALTGASITADKTVISPKDGSNQICISPSTTCSNGISQTITVSQSGVYIFSAYVAEANQTSGGNIGIKRADGESVLNMKIPHTTSYNHLLADGISLEKGDSIVVYANGGNGSTYVDDFELKLDTNSETPVFCNIKSFAVQNQIGDSVINENDHTIQFTMPYGTDTSDLYPTFTLSEGATVTPIGGANFKKPVIYYVKGSNGSVQPWTVTCVIFGVSYNAHVQSKGWQSFVSNGAMAGTTGKSLRVEAVKINLVGAPAGASVSYKAYVQKTGWQKAVSDGVGAGTTGKKLRLEAVKISLNGLSGYEIQYRAYVQGKKWLGWQTVKNGTAVDSAGIAGTTGKALRLEAIEIVIKKVN